MKNTSGIVVAGALALALVAGLTRQVVHAQDSAAAAPQPAKIAVVDMIGVVDKLMSQGSFKTAREQFDAEQVAAQDKIKSEYQAISADVTARLDAAKANEEKATTDEDKAKYKDEQARISEERDSKLGALQARYQGMQGDTDQFTVRMLADAYDLANKTTAQIAQNLGYTYVLASRVGDIPRDKNSQLAFQEILLRSVAVHPAGNDITKLVEKELKLDELPPAGPAPEGAAPAAPTAPTTPKAPEAPAPK